METIGLLLRELRGRVDAMVTRAVINLVNDRLKTQRVQLTILDDEVVNNVEHVQPYGLSFVPPAGAQAVALAIGGSRSYTVALCAEVPGERPQDANAREGGLYTSGQWRVFIGADGTVNLAAKEGADFVALDGLVRDAIKSAIASHKHEVPALGTSGPGVLAGSVASTAAGKTKAT